MIKEIMFKDKKVPQNTEEKTTDAVSLVSDMPVKWKGLKLILFLFELFPFFSLSITVSCLQVGFRFTSRDFSSSSSGRLWTGASSGSVESALPSLGWPDGRKHAAHRAWELLSGERNASRFSNSRKLILSSEGGHSQLSAPHFPREVIGTGGTRGL